MAILTVLGDIEPAAVETAELGPHAGAIGAALWGAE